MENATTMIGSKANPKEAKYAKVLLLDDNALDNFVNKKLIEINNFSTKVEVYESAPEVLKYLTKEKTEQLPDIIF